MQRIRQMVYQKELLAYTRNPLMELTMVITSNLGLLLLAIYLILIGLATFVPTLAIPPVVLGILALAAGILLLLGR